MEDALKRIEVPVESLRWEVDESIIDAVQQSLVPEDIITVELGYLNQQEFGEFEVVGFFRRQWLTIVGGVALAVLVTVIYLGLFVHPLFTSTATPAVAENTTSVVTLTATDIDLPAQTVSFSISDTGVSRSAGRTV